MKVIPFLFALCFLGSCKKESINPCLKQFEITSQKTGFDYDITVYLPVDYSPIDKAYATMYVLDAKQDDAFVAAKCRQISQTLNKQNVIVVGIRYYASDKRDVDYTPTGTSYGGGGCLAFINFIKDELIPTIQASYNVDTSRSKRIIIGHSFGGLFGTYAFTKHNEVFGNYLLLSPSLFYDNSILLKYEQEARGHIKTTKQLIFIGLGSTESGLLPANYLFYQRLQKYYPGTIETFELVPGLGHMTSKNTSIENAINYYFKNQ